ncbi:MAG: LysR family transcriptional regulator [Myxococcota bacterium]
MNIPWSQLRLALAIHREGSVRAAAKALRVSHATVSRQLAELQSDMGVRVFERDGRKLRLTEAGEDLVETAARVEVEVDGLSRRIVGRDHQVEGVVRLALSPSMLAALAPVVVQLSEKHPLLELELVTGLSFANLTRREADVAIRFTNDPQETLVGRKLSLFEQAAYAERALLERLLEQNDIDTWPWIDWDEAHAHHASAVWMRKNVRPERVVARCDSALGMYQLVRTGLAVGFAPTMLAEPDPSLVRVAPRGELPVFHRGIWVLTHEDLRRTGRVRATVDWLAEVLQVKGGGVWKGIRP